MGCSSSTEATRDDAPSDPETTEATTTPGSPVTMLRSWVDICDKASKLIDIDNVTEPEAVVVDISSPTRTQEEVEERRVLKRQEQLVLLDIEARRQQVQMISTRMELAEECKQNKLDVYVSNLASEKLPALDRSQTKHDSQLDSLDKLRGLGWPLSLPIEEGEEYKGLHLPDPLTKDAVIELLDRLNDQARSDCKHERPPQGIKGLLHVKYALKIAVDYMESLRALKNVVYLSTSVADKLTVVGDIHGQLRDLFEIFRYNGFPSFDNPYLFNGDLVDRGEYSTEVCILLMGFAVADPGSVYINRGNHEDMSVCARYGFMDELAEKFVQKAEGRQMFGVMDAIFSLLPLAHVVDDSILVIHGGISDKFTLKSLSEINRRSYRTLTGHRVEQKEDSKAMHECMMDALWSDPDRLGEQQTAMTTPQNKSFSLRHLSFRKEKKSTLRCWPNEARGGGVFFSSEMSREWLDAEGLGCMIRSHECQDHGFSSCHEDRVLTLFSASNYYGGAAPPNDGAILLLSKKGGRILTYSTSYSDYCNYRALDLASSTGVAKMEAEALKRVGIALLDHRRELVARFTELDPSETGVLPAAEWAGVMEAIVPIKLPWLHLASHFVEPLEDGEVRYTKLTEKLGTAFGDDQKTESLYRLRGELQRLFRILDLDDSGVLDREELLQGCEVIKSLSNNHFSPETNSNLDEFITKLDTNNDGKITFQEFSDGLLAPSMKPESRW